MGLWGYLTVWGCSGGKVRVQGPVVGVQWVEGPGPGLGLGLS